MKTGFVEDFTASTEAELRLFNAVLVTEWPEQMTHCAFMITEDDGVLSFRDRHLAPAAVEMQGESLTVVK